MLKRMKRVFKVGTVIPVSVKQEHINDSDPCNKDNCMLTRAFSAALVETCGGKVSDYRVKSTNHGLVFDLGGRRHVTVFDTKTGTRIFNYDKVFKTKHSKEAAQASVRPFQARLIVEASTAVPKFPPMSEATKKRLAETPRRPKAERGPRSNATRRELSL